MSSIRTLIVAGAYLRHAKAAAYLSEDARYDVALVEVNEAENAIQQSSLLPALCIIEWGKEIYHNDKFLELVNECKRLGIATLIVIPNEDEIVRFCELHDGSITDFILLPLLPEELRMRAAMAVGRKPRPYDSGMIRIDDYLAIDFENSIARLGYNHYETLSVTDTLFLKYLYDNINRWVHVDELKKNTAIVADRVNNSLYPRLSKLKRQIEDNPKNPRYLLSNKHGMYMLHSKQYPKGDSLIGFTALKNRKKK